MTGSVVVPNDMMKGVADAIRAKTGSSAEMKVSDMAAEVASISVERETQEKTVSMTDLGPVTVTPDGDKVLSSVTVNPPSDAVIPSGTVTISDLNETSVASYEKAKVDPANIVEGNIRSGVEILGITGTYEGSGKEEQTKSVDITDTNAVTVTPDSGYTLSSVTAQVKDANLVAANIASGVTVLGITGTHEGGSGSFVNVWDADIEYGGVQTDDSEPSRTGTVIGVAHIAEFNNDYVGAAIIDVVPNGDSTYWKDSKSFCTVITGTDSLAAESRSSAGVTIYDDGTAGPTTDPLHPCVTAPDSFKHIYDTYFSIGYVSPLGDIFVYFNKK